MARKFRCRAVRTRGVTSDVVANEATVYRCPPLHLYSRGSRDETRTDGRIG